MEFRREQNEGNERKLKASRNSKHEADKNESLLPIEASVDLLGLVAIWRCTPFLSI
jgi:hypothetical protein